MVYAESDNQVIMPTSLTYENGAKGLLAGEFFEEIEVKNPQYCGCGKCDFCVDFPDTPQNEKMKVPVSWTTIKAIFRACVENLAAGRPTQTESSSGEPVDLADCRRVADTLNGFSEQYGHLWDETDYDDVAAAVAKLREQCDRIGKLEADAMRKDKALNDILGLIYGLLPSVDPTESVANIRLIALGALIQQEEKDDQQSS